MDRRLIFVAFALLLSGPAFGEVTVEADQLSYDVNGEAQAEGDVMMRGQGFSLTADQVHYHPQKGIAWIKGSPARLSDGSMHLALSEGRYDFVRREGTLTDLFFTAPAGKGQAYVRAAEGRAQGGEEVTYRLQDVALTTSRLPTPVYEFRLDEVTYHLSGRTLLRRPELRWHGYRIFRLPFDFSLNAQGGDEQNSMVLPTLTYKNGALGLSYAGFWHWGAQPLESGIAAYLNGDYELYGHSQWSLWGGAASARLSYEKNRLAPHGLVRSDLSYRRTLKGWSFSARAAMNAHVSTFKSRGQSYELRLDWLPSLSATSPWFKFGPGRGVQGWAEAGLVREKSDLSPKGALRGRLALGARGFADANLGAVRSWVAPSLESVWYQGGAYQKTLRVQAGLKGTWGRTFGALALDWQGVWGRSPFRFDRKSSYFYLYPSVGFSLGNTVDLELQAKFDVKGARLRWVEGLATIADGDAAHWKVYYRQPLAPGEERKVGLQFVLDAFPNQPLGSDVGLMSFGTRPSALN